MGIFFFQLQRKKVFHHVVRPAKQIYDMLLIKIIYELFQQEKENTEIPAQEGVLMVQLYRNIGFCVRDRNGVGGIQDCIVCHGPCPPGGVFENQRKHWNILRKHGFLLILHHPDIQKMLSCIRQCKTSIFQALKVILCQITLSLPIPHVFTTVCLHWAMDVIHLF